MLSNIECDLVKRYHVGLISLNRRFNSAIRNLPRWSNLVMMLDCHSIDQGSNP